MAYDGHEIALDSPQPHAPPSSDERRARDELDELLAGGPAGNLAGWLQNVAEDIPMAVGVDFVNLRVLSGTGALHLVAASGCSATEIRKRAFTPVGLDSVAQLLAQGGHDEVARSLGIGWVHLRWLGTDSEPLGAVTVGCRTQRRPRSDDLAFLDHVTSDLADRLNEIDRSDAVLKACAMSLAHAHRPTEWPGDQVVARLRRRERAILELYADGLGTEEIADLLVLSRHTVRTHVRNALRTLGVHSREEAATLVRGDQLAQLL